MKSLAKLFLWIVFLFFTLHSVSIAHSKKYIAFTDVGNGTPLILIHAFPTDQQLWTSQREVLKNYFRVITLDLWGFGLSSKADGNAIRISDFADEVKQLMDQLHIQKAIICGESMGGYVALSFLKKYPDNVSGIILSDTQSIADTTEIKNKREMAALDVLEHGSMKFIQNFMPKALSPDADASIVTFLKTILDKQSEFAIASALRGMALREDTSDILSTTHTPVLIISGDQDVLISPQQSQSMHEKAKNSRLVMINHAGHLSSLEQPDQWNKAVIEMFER